MNNVEQEWQWCLVGNIGFLEWLNPKEAVKEKDRWLNSGDGGCESEYIKKMMNMVDQVPKGVPLGWKCHTIAVDGLLDVDFSHVQTEKLICVSSQGQCVINCETMQKTYCATKYDDMDGLWGGDKAGIFVRKFWPHWPKEQLILYSDFQSAGSMLQYI